MNVRLLRGLLLGLIVCATWAVACSYNLSYFYVRGAAVYDAGWFAWLAAHAAGWPMLNPTDIGGNFLAIHMSTIFFLTSMLLKPFACVPEAVAFSAVFALWAPVLFLSLWLLLERFGIAFGGRCGVALLLTGNGLILSMVGFPHIEIFIPALGLLTIALGLRASGAVSWFFACLAAALLLSIREDAGFHMALPLLAMALTAPRGDTIRHRCIGLALVALCAGIATLATQKLFVPGGGQALGNVYLGQPLFAQLSLGSTARRLVYWATRRTYIFAPLVVLLSARDRRLALGVLIGLPWLALSLVAATQPAGDLWDYYCFPLVFAVVWPLLLGQIAAPASLLRLQIRIGLVSTGLFVIVGLVPFVGDGGSHDRNPWTHLVPPTMTAIRATEAALAHADDTIMDDGAASLALGRIQPWQYRLSLNFSATDLARAQSFVEFTVHPTYQMPKIEALQRMFPYCVRLADTDLQRCTR